MNPIAFIPEAAQVWLRVAMLVLVAAAGWFVRGWKDGQEVAGLKAAQTAERLAASTAALAKQRELQADRDELAAKLSSQSASFHSQLTRKQNEIALLRRRVATGASVVRINGADCSASGVPQASEAGRVDSGAGAVLTPAAGQDVLDLRAGIERLEGKLAACQAGARTLTGQP